ncbi:MAG: hypothetical protein LBU34_17085 [Planctomycetaceae bacterium]|nr:hypothetical protein [Planctomycetaceae bacterium]
MNCKSKDRQSLAERLRRHQPTNKFMLCWMFGLPIGKQPLRRAVAYLTHHRRKFLYYKDLRKHISGCSRPGLRSQKLGVHRE